MIDIPNIEKHEFRTEPSMIRSPNSPIWAITTYYNPAGFKSRLINFKTFRNHLKIPLIVVELSFDKPFDLTNTEAEVVVQLNSGSVLWQKERLLNIAIQHVPQNVPYIAWIDCDMLFSSNSWDHNACSLLQKHPIIQLYDRIHFLDRGILTLPCPLPDSTHDHRSFSANFLKGIPSWTYHGGAWAARSELLRQHSLYDSLILGGGDTVTAKAVFGIKDVSEITYMITEILLNHYRNWADKFTQSIIKLGTPGCLNETLYHLWHGDSKNRNYVNRYVDLKPFNFNPVEDLKLNAQGAWEWASNKPNMHKYIREYFSKRLEDG